MMAHSTRLDPGTLSNQRRFKAWLKKCSSVVGGWWPAADMNRRVRAENVHPNPSVQQPACPAEFVSLPGPAEAANATFGCTPHRSDQGHEVPRREGQTPLSYAALTGDDSDGRVLERASVCRLPGVNRLRRVTPCRYRWGRAGRQSSVVLGFGWRIPEAPGGRFISFPVLR